ncbi:hypothetical protein ACHAWF_015144 [Thalassiosira exigua]
MFSNQDVDHSLNRPCRTLAAVAPPKSSSKPASDEGGGGGGDGWDDDDDYLDASSAFASHRFLVGSAVPSVSKLSYGGDDVDDGDGDESADREPSDLDVLDEEDEARTNRLHLLTYREDAHELALERSWVHPAGEVWATACHPVRGDWVATCGGGAAFSPDAPGTEDRATTATKDEDVPLTKFATALWRLPELSDDLGDDEEDDVDFGEEGPRRRSGSAASAMTTSSKMELVATIPHGKTSRWKQYGWERRVGQILWSPALFPSQSSGDALFDLAESSSSSEGGGGNVLTVGWDARSPVSLWDVSSLSEAKEVWSAQGNVGGRRRRRSSADPSAMRAALPRRASWDPHDARRILATAGTDVAAYDVRCDASDGGGVATIRAAHRRGVADVCHNPLQSHVAVTAGMDGVVKFWDLRMHSSSSDDACDNASSRKTPPPLLKAVRGGHSHWTTRAAYNPFHDQLVLSGGSDGVANLWRISSCSSAPLLDLEGDDEDDEDDEGAGGSSFDADDDEGGAGENGQGDVGREEPYDREGWSDAGKRFSAKSGDESTEPDEADAPPRNESDAQDVRVTRFECSDVAADVAWSASDPWVYATLSCDGAVVVHHVPSKEKYKILL